MDNKINNKNNKKNTGFTLVETLVAISILLISIVGPLTIASNGLSSAGLVKEKIAAFYFAQEGVELVRNQRDVNIINGSDWLNNLSTCFDTKGCLIDPRNITPVITMCDVGGCEALKQNIVNELYGYESGVDWIASPFTRTIKISTINGQEIRLSVEMSWVRGGSVKNLTIDEHLFNWQ